MRILILLLAACSTPAFSGGSQWYLGDWKVTEARYPGISAMTEEEAAEWVGNTIHYSNSSVEFLDQTCNAPIYESEARSPGDFRVRNTSMDVLEINTPMFELIEVDCTPSWLGPGFSIIKKDEHSGYIFWDGAYFLIIKESL